MDKNEAYNCIYDLIRKVALTGQQYDILKGALDTLRGPPKEESK